jgi:hypothetical protein
MTLKTVKRPICLISSNHCILMVKNTSMSTESLAETMICSALAEVHKVQERYSVTRVDIKTSRTWVSVSFAWLVFKVAFKMSLKRAKTQRQGIRYNIPKVQEWYSKSILTKLIRDIHLRNRNYRKLSITIQGYSKLFIRFKMSIIPYLSTVY